MVRIKRGINLKHRRQKILKLTKSFQAASKHLYRVAHQRVLYKFTNNYTDRKNFKRSNRKLWISRLNAIARINNFKYHIMMHRFEHQHYIINRKILAQLALYDQPSLVQIICI